MKYQIVVGVLAVIGVLAMVFTACRVAATVMSTEVVLGCSQQRNAEYCVYHRTTWGLLNTEYEILVGPSSNRGLIYSVPYPAHEARVTWAAETALLTIEMPGTALTIEAAEYLETR
ncbi:hypothetical protein [Nocardia salmonicida]|uniref:hypothetical protein n=1 Tax=Nocardia salmonicida TaxID=53431 RepID=UPI002E27FADA|nr:hypothetical protein [Nocardia salmonicida]